MSLLCPMHEKARRAQGADGLVSGRDRRQTSGALSGPYTTHLLLRVVETVAVLKKSRRRARVGCLEIDGRGVRQARANWSRRRPVTATIRDPGCGAAW